MTKFLLVTDGQVDLRDFKKTLAHILERADFRTDLFLFSNLSMDTLDYAGPRLNEGSKGVLLGLGEARRQLPGEFHGEAPGLNDVRVFGPGCLVLEAGSHAEDPDAGARCARMEVFRDWPLLVLSDDAERSTRSAMNFLWSTFTAFDPARDIHAAKTELAGVHPCFTPPLVIDARAKAGYPAELLCDEATREKVDRRWKEYFPGGQEQGDSDRAHLD